MFITADMLLCHAIGDYVLQSDWMANQKTKEWKPAIAHVVTYTLPFVFLTRSPIALSIILLTHLVIDHWRLARYVCWLKNFMQPESINMSSAGFVCLATTHHRFRPERLVIYSIAPEDQICKCGVKMELVDSSFLGQWRNHPWIECAATGYYKDRPVWMTVWLMIITDNIMHVICNGLAIKFFG